MKFTDEELSRVLSAHVVGALQSEGEIWIGNPAYGVDYKACVIQAAYVIREPGRAYGCDEQLARNFDREYQSSWSPGELLRWLESQGVA